MNFNKNKLFVIATMNNTFCIILIKNEHCNNTHGFVCTSFLKYIFLLKYIKYFPYFFSRIIPQRIFDFCSKNMFDLLSEYLKQALLPRECHVFLCYTYIFQYLNHLIDLCILPIDNRYLITVVGILLILVYYIKLIASIKNCIIIYYKCCISKYFCLIQ